MSKKTSKPRVATLKVKKSRTKRGHAYTLLTAANGETLDCSEIFSSISNARRGVEDRVLAYADVVREHGYVCYLPVYCDDCGASNNPNDDADNCSTCGHPFNEDNDND